MNVPSSVRLVSLVFIAILSACANRGMQPASFSGGDLPIGAGLSTHRDQGKSWINPAMKHGRLLYVSDDYEQDVQVFTYPNLKHAGTLMGFASPEGECTDKAGDIWITDTGAGDVVEYAHGGTSPIATLAVTTSVGCSINPRTGDLAVTQAGESQFVLVFPKATGSPTGYTDGAFASSEFLAYDKDGNLFVDGFGQSGLRFAYAELPAGASSFTNITLSTIPAAPGGVQWDGHHMAVGDRGPNIYRFAGATIVGTTKLNNACAFQFFIVAGKRIIAPSQALTTTACDIDADIYAYPAGGAPRKHLTRYLIQPFGAAVSNG